MTHFYINWQHVNILSWYDDSFNYTVDKNCIKSLQNQMKKKIEHDKYEFYQHTNLNASAIKVRINYLSLVS